MANPIRRWLQSSPHAGTVGPLVVAAAVTLALVALITLVVPTVGPWAWVAVAAPAASPIIDEIRAGRRRRREQHRDLSLTDLKGADLQGVDLASGYLRNKDLSSARLVEAKLADADLTGATLVDTRFHRADLTRARLDQARCDAASFYRCVLFEASLDGVNAQGTSFEEADLRGASLVGADLRRARFDGADLRQADLTGAIVGPRALARAVTDATTTMPDGAAAAAVGRVAPTRSIRSTPGPRLITGDLLRPALLGLGGALAVGGAVASAGSTVGGAGFEIAADLAGEATTNGRSVTDGNTRSTTARQVEPGIGVGRSDSDADSGSGSGSDSGTGGAAGDSREAPDDGTGGAAEQATDGSGSLETADGRITGVGELREPSDSDEAPAIGTGGVTTTTGGAPEDLLATDETDPGAASSTSTTGSDSDSGSGSGSGSETDADDESPLTEAPETGADRAVQEALLESPNPTSPTGQILARTIEVVITSDGQSSAASIRSAIGDGGLVVTDVERVVLDAGPGGPVSIDVSPSDEATAASCAILVDGVQRSFRQGFAGEAITCTIDLGSIASP